MGAVGINAGARAAIEDGGVVGEEVPAVDVVDEAVAVVIDPVPGRVAYPFRVLLVVLTLPFHAFLGVTIMGQDALIGGDWYPSLHDGPMGAWLPDPLDDQHLAGGILWGSGDLIGLVFFAVLLAAVLFAADEAFFVAVLLAAVFAALAGVFLAATFLVVGALAADFVAVDLFAVAFAGMMVFGPSPP